MRYYSEKPSISKHVFGEIYYCDHPIYDVCTLFKIHGKGLAVIQQRFCLTSKNTYWTDIDPWLANAIYTNPRFRTYFLEHADNCKNGLYPTVTVRQIMWALRMKPLPKQPWETVFDHTPI